MAMAAANRFAKKPIPIEGIHDATIIFVITLKAYMSDAVVGPPHHNPRSFFRGRCS